MPDLPFVLPHWLYWAGLILFPLAAMALVWRQRRAAGRPAVSNAVGYLLLLTAGFAGLHRYYLRDWKGVIFLPFLAVVLWANIAARDAREAVSSADSDVMIADFDRDRAEARVDAGEAGAEAELEAASAAADAAAAAVAEAHGGFDRAMATARYAALAIAVLLLIDAVLLPRLVRRQNGREPPPAPAAAPDAGSEMGPSPGHASPIARAIAALNRWSGEFVAYWSVLAVFAYYYEVVARYLFNSPTNWVHESMFLMFGMQYLIAGGYAYLTDSHVRVDVFYSRFSRRGKALTDVLTSVFFFIFAGTLLVTGWIFAADSLGVWEVSFTEWAIQYWPVKIAIIVGAALILLQGIAKLLDDLRILVAGEA